MNLLSTLSIKARIHLGFSLICLFIIIISIIAYRGTLTTTKSFNEYVEINQSSQQIHSIDKSVSELQRSVLNYIYTGYEAVVDRVNRDSSTLEAVLQNQLVNNLNDHQDRSYLKRMLTHLQNYKKTFSFAVEERKKRKVLVALLKNQLPKLLHSVGSQSSLYTVLINAEKNIYEYLDDPNIIKINKTLADLDSEISTIDETIQLELQQYRATVFDVVQSTRGFLFLISVVLAAESQEFSYVSNLLKEHALAKVAPLRNNLHKENSQTQKIVIIATLTLLLLAITFSLKISNSINTPLTKLTYTFKRLANDDDVLSIPGLNLKDEIGEMSQAAEIFRQKNELTKNLVKELDDKKAALERSVDEMDQFVYTVSHDLKSPIVTSMGFIGMMKDMASNGDYEAVLSKLPRLEKANARMNQLINDLLELSRVDQNNMTPEKVNMKVLIEDVFKSHQIKLLKNNIKTQIQGDIPDLFINESRAMQLFDNIITNAIKYCSNENGPEIIVGATQSQEGCAFFIKDNGPGISKEYHEKVFILFQRLSNDSNGTGIGLSIVQKIMKTYGGRVWIDSGEDVDGCTFWLEFPRALQKTI
jgi:signal transduction histidine kinase